MRFSDSSQLNPFTRRESTRSRVICVLLLSMALIAWMDFVLVPNSPISHLYYIPILIAAIRLGRTPAIGVAVLAAVFAHLADSDRSRFTLLFREADRAMYENKRVRRQAVERALAALVVLPPPALACAPVPAASPSGSTGK